MSGACPPVHGTENTKTVSAAVVTVLRCFASTVCVLHRDEDIITCFEFGDDRLRGLESAEGQILPFFISFDGRPYNTLTLPCQRVPFSDCLL